MDIIIRFGLSFLMLVHWVYTFFKSWTFVAGRKTSVPPDDNRLLNLSALTLAKKIRERKIFSQEVVQVYIKRIKEVNPIINAVAENRFEAAMAEAKEIDQYLDNNRDKVDELKRTKPLLGVPITVKESIAVKGLSYTGGTTIRKNMKADKDSVVVQYLKDAGVIPLLVSNTPEYCTCLSTYNKNTGHTYNPYNTQYTSGGSSGGEGALLGAGASVMGIGSDLIGSIRLPAMFNGIFGHKPTAKIVSLEGHLPLTDEDTLRSYLVIGPLTRYAEDLKPLLKILAGPKSEYLKLDEKVELSKIVVFYTEDIGNSFCLPKTDKNIKNAIKTATAYLSKECHCHINNSKLEKFFSKFIEISTYSLSCMKNFPSPLNDTEVKYNVCSEVFKGFFGKSVFTMQHLLILLSYEFAKYLPIDSKKIVNMLNELRKTLETALGDNGVLILPCGPGSAPLLQDYYISLPSSFNTSIFNMLGFPATAVPTGFDSHKMPIGLQVVGGPNQDRLTIAVAQELEKCFGGWQAVP